ncbi:fumarylacetoacetate hydrolase family protein [Pseudomonas japonica]|uniref:fumarylacetoacetate hydrolase family protein n=1 Tax=Pseudomonas japonica TaxID=256466 RepID=UPI0015E2A561|nr:fumarylacetoacetate hydrolase family protein [Pseudomonas japonica]MBA1242598.1 fumarylacetoacetate hydrolase family protein [Pseudomonas japonica]
MTRYCSFERNGKASWGAVNDDQVVDLGARFGHQYPDLKAVLAAGWPAEVAEAVGQGGDYALSEVTLLAPITDPLHIWCLALNYVEHHNEVQNAGRVQELPKQPALFGRTRDSLTAHGQPLLHPGVSEQFDFEGELVVVIGKPGYRISQADAWGHVAGYTLMNEGSVRDWQFHTRQITPGKNFYRSGSVGPWIVPASEVPDVDALRIQTRLNGQVMQDDLVASMVHKIPRFIEYASTLAPLQPGDLLATGTPSGVGFSRQPPVFMQPGDVCEISVEGIGVLRNPVERQP